MEGKKWDEEKSIYDMSINLVRNGILTLDEENHLLELLEEREQIRNHQIVYSMILSAIEENQLKEEEEQELKQLLLESRQKRERGEEAKLKNTSFASFVQFVMERESHSRSSKESIIQIYYSILEKCFKNNSIGKMNVSTITESDIRKCIIEVYQLCDLDKIDIKVFWGLLQMGLNAAMEMNMLNFVPEKMYSAYITEEKCKHYIKNPYTVEETKSILKWVHENPDIRGLAIGLFFLADVSLKEIIELRRDAIVRDDAEEEIVIQKTNSNQYLLLTEERKKIIKYAMKLYSCDEPEYIFSVEMDSKWKKLTAQGLSGKLFHICKALGIEYKGFRHNDVIKI